MNVNNIEPSEWLKTFSSDTWDRILFSWNTLGLKTYETTITQNLLFQLFQATCFSNGKIKAYEATNEKANGNDIEFYVEYHRGYIFHPIQAKIVYQNNNKYPKLNHNIGGVQQINNLLKYALKEQGIPLYFFFNSSKIKAEIANLKTKNYKTYGISFVEANLLKSKYLNTNGKWRIPKFKDVNPDLALPLHMILPQSEGNIHRVSFYREIIKKIDQIKFYEKDEILNEPSWIELNPNEGIGRIDIPSHANSSVIDLYKSPKVDTDKRFNAKYRFVFSQNRFNSAISFLR